jgi:hypothetical protein
MYCHVVKSILTNVSEVHTATNLGLMMEAVRTSETSVIYLTTWQYIPEDSKLHTHHCENVKSLTYSRSSQSKALSSNQTSQLQDSTSKQATNAYVHIPLTPLPPQNHNQIIIIHMTLRNFCKLKKNNVLTMEANNMNHAYISCNFTAPH